MSSLVSMTTDQGGAPAPPVKADVSTSDKPTSQATQSTPEISAQAKAQAQSLQDKSASTTLEKPQAQVNTSAGFTATVGSTCPETTTWNTTLGHEDISHQMISSYFIGPQAENLAYFEQNIHTILEQLRIGRTSYFPEDGKFITEHIQNTEAFKASTDRLQRAVKKAAELLGRTSIPFWSPRYEAHMCMDLTMPSVLGYFMTMMYNPNNVALEASPITTVAEIDVGEQLCELFGFNIDVNQPEEPTGWGHITCDGTVANLESMWVARNLKFYPLSLRTAMSEGEPLEFLSSVFYVQTCQGEQKLFYELSNWELLNLRPTDILDIPDRLYSEHGISNDYLSEVMKKFTIQSTGKDSLEQKFGIEHPCQYMLANTRHYSWPKGAAISGIGSDNAVGIPVDHAARIDLTALDTMLQDRLEKQQAVYAVVAIVGSTEEGAVDPLTSILALRKKYQAKGLSFVVHADAAWGGYFCTMLPKDYHPGDPLSLPPGMGVGAGFVPDASLRTETQEDLYAMRFADSITVDPHKAGYIPYPAGGLCYRDGRMRYLVTWTSPYLSRGSVTSIGIYGVEGSKPGAAAMSTWLSNRTIGLNPDGYGKLLSEVTWTCTRFSAEWAALTDLTSPFICVPFNELPSELAESSTPEKVEAEKARIRQEILKKTNAQIILEDLTRPDDQKAIKLLRSLGSDLNINAFALNFRHADGTLNGDVEEANYLMQRVVEALSVDSPTDDPTKIPLYLTSTEFSDELYGDCKKHFLKRLGLEDSTNDLMVLRNVVMSPFPTDGNFISQLADIFYKTVEAETKIVRKRNELGEAIHSFLIQGTEQIYLIHFPMFHVANHRQQLIVSVDLDERSRDAYVELKRSNPTEPLLLVTQNKTFMQEVVANNGAFAGQIMTKESGIVLKDVNVTITNTVVSRPLNSKWRLRDYPDRFMPFYLYGTSNDANIDHVLTRAPNTQLSASGCKLQLSGGEMDDDNIWSQPLVAILEDVYEATMQPFPTNSEIGSRHGAIVARQQQQQRLSAAAANGDISPSTSSSKGNLVTTSNSGSRRGMRGDSGFFFRPGARFAVAVYQDGNRPSENVEHACFKLGDLVGRGQLELGQNVYVDSEAVNLDPFKRPDKVNEWRYEFEQIGKELD